jgi:phenylalanyl-tRNA synthetase beta chain
MKISRNWLEEFVDLGGIEAADLGDRITMTTAEIEGIEAFGEGLSGIVAGRIVDVRAHAGADRLKVAEVEIGDRTVEVVCGAPNTRTGLVVPVALPGTTLPGGQRIEAARIQGVASAGMLCSIRELGLGDDHSGLLTLDATAEPGRPLPEVLPVEDVVFEIDNKSLTHRPDLWGHHGFAREIAGFLGRELRPLDLAEEPAGEGAIPVIVEDAKLCPRYIGLVLEGLAIGVSPSWMQARLLAVGVRPISNIVDFTNYVMLEIGQPMHAFDRAKIEGPEIRVRTARPGEVLRTLDGTERRLDPETLVIADRERAVAIAGIMGGAESEISEETREMILESANFDPVSVRRSAARLGLRTEAAARFEKSLDPEFARLGVLRFLRLCEREQPEARASGGLADAYVGAPEPRVISIGIDKIRRRLGIPITSSQVRSFLEGIEFGVEEDGSSLRVTVPSFRATKDVTIEEDVIEEVGRLYGYDNIEESPLEIVCAPPPRDAMRDLEWELRDGLALGAGCQEVSLYSFVSDEAVEAFGRPGESYRRLRNPIASNLARLRTSLVPNLLMTLPANLRNFHDLRVFELGRVYPPAADPSEGREHEEVCVLRCRRAVGKKAKRGESEEVFRSVQGVLEYVLDRTGVRGWTLEPGSGTDWPWAHPARTARVLQGERELGVVTQLHPGALRSLKLEAEAALFVLRLDTLLAADRAVRRYRPIPRFPAVYQDLAVIVDDAVRVGDVEAAIRESGGEIVEDVRLFDVWRGKPVESGRKSLAFEIVYLSRDRTLRDEEVAEVHAAICDRLVRDGGAIRGSS